MDRARPRPHWPLLAWQGTSCPSHFASAATHNTSQAALYSSRSCAGDPLLVIDHRIMLDVESVPGPSLLSSFGTPQERSVSWRQPFAVLAWILCPCGNRTGRTGLLKGRTARNFYAFSFRREHLITHGQSQPYVLFRLFLTRLQAISGYPNA
jgi:hypothetical protein